MGKNLLIIPISIIVSCIGFRRRFGQLRFTLIVVMMMMKVLVMITRYECGYLLVVLILIIHFNITRLIYLINSELYV